MAQPGERRGVLRGQLKKVEERLDNVEWRLGRVELAQEQTDQYRRLRVEHSPRLQEVWRAFEAKEFEPHELRAKVAVAVGADVRECMGREVDEEALQAKSRELSHGRRCQFGTFGWPRAWPSIWLPCSSGCIRTGQAPSASSSHAVSPAECSRRRSKIPLTGRSLFWQSSRGRVYKYTETVDPKHGQKSAARGRKQERAKKQEKAKENVRRERKEKDAAKDVMRRSEAGFFRADFSGGPGIMVAPGKTHFRGTSSGPGRSPLWGTSPGS